MKVILDTRTCKVWDAACEAHFAWHFLRDEVTPVDCTVEVVDDGQSTITFCITDRDGSEKTLVIDEKNKPEAIDSWRLAWEEQQKKEGK